MSIGDPETTDARLVALATDHIRQNGPERLTVVAVARAAGMSHANLYRYFPSKAALVDAVTAAWLRPLEAMLRDVADGPDPADHKLERLIGTLFRAYRDKLETDPVVFGLLADAVASNTPAARRHVGRLQSDCARVLEEGTGSGLFEPSDERRTLSLLFDTLFRFIHPVAIRLDADLGRTGLENRRERAMRLFLRAIARRGQRF